MYSIGIYDLDGTIWRSVAAALDIFRTLLVQHGAKDTPELTETVRLNWSVHYSRWLDRFLPGYSDAKIKGIYEAIRPLSPIIPFDGVDEALGAIQRMGVANHILTARPRTHTQFLLHKFGQKDLFARVVSTGDYGHDKSKPSPYGANLIINPYRKIGFDRDNAFLVGDTPNADLECARNAGIKFVAVHEENVITREEWLKHGVPEEDVLPSIRCLPDWLKRSNART